ncbi:MAG TPA: hybrid sensor histidine kinase/response regulator [Candidatus Limnocylindrales bacterium]|nr:hybrid sensor histidine kinase/response regulator [Candidatus Limnocylindrales bacterium]
MTPEPASSNSRGHLLIVDDEEQILNALRRQFKRDYEVYTALSADEACQLLKRTPIEVVISDQRMPRTTGSEFLCRVKEDHPDVVRLLLTGHADIQAVIDSVNQGSIYRYITKPWEPEELASTVRAAFSRYELVARNRQLFDDLVEANHTLEARVAERTAELELANRELLATIEEKNRLLGMAAHDLRTPITIITGFIDLITDTRTTPEDFDEFVSIIRGTLHDMLTLLNSLLDLSAIESGKVQLALARTDVNEFVQRVARIQRVLGAQKQIRVATFIEPGLPVFSFDRVRIDQVLTNLFSNAFKFSYNDTTVTLSVRRSGDSIEFSVTDQGIGISPEDLSRVFYEFQKLQSRPTANESSTGLGLSICRRIVEMHGGTIGVESKAGQGSRFYFLLPIAPVTESIAG